MPVLLLGPPPFRARLPLIVATAFPLFDRTVRERLTVTALDWLFARAWVLSEGGRARALPRPDGTRAPDPYFGSTMLTLDLAAVAGEITERADASTTARVAQLVAEDTRAARRARRIAELEAGRIAGTPVDAIAFEVQVRASGTTLALDVDIEGHVRPHR